MDERKYPIGIQTFETIRNDGYVYVDKTKLVYDMVNAGKYFFLSRPRRFGKSLLVSTFQSYFEGRKDLFEGLAISNLEKEWTTYPVIHLDLSLAKSTLSAEELMGKLHLLLRDYVRKYDTDEGEVTPGGLLRGLIRRAYQRYNRPVVVLIDEYDAPLLDVLHNEESLKDIRIVMQEFYQPLKACEAMIRYCFITGITKFSQLSIFSTINNIRIRLFFIFFFFFIDATQVCCYLWYYGRRDDNGVGRGRDQNGRSKWMYA